ncbi:MAG: putative baseplate assembly protein, partial [Cyanobacteria bacterium J06621_15]
MKFDFLPNLEKPNLDDRKFKDLVEECILRIPRYCPEWTNHNPGDPGITLIELFAWLTDQMLLRFNQVPLLNYITFLELLGIRLQPPTPARCELTFYLSKEQPKPVRIPSDTEVATVRTENDEAVIFATNDELVIGNPQIKHFLTATETTETTDKPQDFFNSISPQRKEWNIKEAENIDELLLFEYCHPGNCFYLVLDELETNFKDDEERKKNPNTIAGNVLAINFKGEAAQTTGINPDNPPLKWEAWNGERWLTLKQDDDQTKGFSFHGVPQSLENGADVILRLPQKLPHYELADSGNSYSGYWIRCVFIRQENQEEINTYYKSPTVTSISVSAIGGAVYATQSTRVENESLGFSNGKPGQIFELQSKPILDRREQEEYIEILLPGETEPEKWQEVEDFGKSIESSKHYIIDSVTGTVQFGPLVREPSRLREFTGERKRNQQHKSQNDVDVKVKPYEHGLTYIQPVSDNIQALESQYGAVPPPGAEIFMKAYRTGGGSWGNVKAGTLSVFKYSIPYVKSVINYQEATGGTDSESLEQAAIRVPQILRTRECAVIPEDFERIIKQAKASRNIVRAHCAKSDTGGVVRLLLVPEPNNFQPDANNFCGTNPDDLIFNRDDELKKQLINYIDNRKPLGIQVRLEEPR